MRPSHHHPADGPVEAPSSTSPPSPPVLSAHDHRAGFTPFPPPLRLCWCCKKRTRRGTEDSTGKLVRLSSDEMASSSHSSVSAPSCAPSSSACLRSAMMLCAPQGAGALPLADVSGPLPFPARCTHRGCVPSLLHCSLPAALLLCSCPEPHAGSAARVSTLKREAPAPPMRNASSKPAPSLRRRPCSALRVRGTRQRV